MSLRASCLPVTLAFAAVVLVAATGCDPSADSVDDGPADATSDAIAVAHAPTVDAAEEEELQGGSSILSAQGPVEPDDAVLVVPAAKPQAAPYAAPTPPVARTRAVAGDPSGDGGEPAGAPDGPTPRALLGARRAALPPVAPAASREADHAATRRGRRVRVILHAPPQQVHRWRHRLRGLLGRWIHLG